MKKIKSVLYVSLGNLPSKLASSIQVAKMSQALAQKVKKFELVTGGDVFSALRGMDPEFQSWYALKHKFKLVRIPVHLKVKYPFHKNYVRQSYLKWAVLYAYFKSPTFVYTRSDRIAAPLLKLGIPVLWERHDLLAENLPSDSFFRQALASKNLIGLITLSPQVAENYIKNGLSSEKVFIAHSGVDTSIYLPYKSKNVAREQLSLAQDAKIILYGGHLYDHKGISTILEVASLMPEGKFILVGGWQADIRRVKAICLERGLHNVDIVGHVPQNKLAIYLYAADILLLPTSKQWQLAETTSPMKLFEYMAVKRPIVASALPNIMTVLRDRQNALLAEPDAPLSFKSAIEELLANPPLAEELAFTAFQEVDRFTWDSRAKTILQFARERLSKMSDHTLRNRISLLKHLKRIVLN